MELTANVVDILLECQEDERGKPEQHEFIGHVVHSRLPREPYFSKVTRDQCKRLLAKSLPKQK